MNSVAFSECFEVSHDHFRQIRKIRIYMDRIWQWRHRSWPEVEKWTAQHKFFIDYDAKRIRSISLTSFEKKIQNCPSLKKISTLKAGPDFCRSTNRCVKELPCKQQISMMSVMNSLLFQLAQMQGWKSRHLSTIVIQETWKCWTWPGEILAGELDQHIKSVQWVLHIATKMMIMELKMNWEIYLINMATILSI